MNWFHVAMDLRPWFLVSMTALFALIAWRVLRPSRRRFFEEAARIPLRDGR